MDVFLGQIIYAGFNFAPQGWAFCDGSLQSIAENSPLFSLIGTTFGGDGVNTFALPDLRSRVPVGSGPNYTLGQPGGLENVQIQSNQYPNHSHSVMASSNNGSSNSPGGNLLAAGQNLYSTSVPALPMNAVAIAPALGGGQLHSNIQPYQACNWIIALAGIFPTQN